jgi:hypothetical protein
LCPAVATLDAKTIFGTFTVATACSTMSRYLKAIVLRLDKWRADPARDAAKLLELKPQEQRYWRLVAERKGAVDDRMLGIQMAARRTSREFLCTRIAHATTCECQAA